MKAQSLLSKEDLHIMKPLENQLQLAFEDTKKRNVPLNKNFFAMSLKHFFQNLSEEQMELMCHNYIHSWINDHLSKSSKFFNKYRVEEKLDYMRQNSMG